MTTATANLTEKAISAAARYLDRRGYEVLTDSNEGAAKIVALDEEGTLVFCSVTVKTDSLGEEEVPRSDMEMSAANYLAANAKETEADVRIRLDVITLLVVSAERALIRHHINAYGE